MSKRTREAAGYAAGLVIKGVATVATVKRKNARKAK